MDDIALVVAFAFKAHQAFIPTGIFVQWRCIKVERIIEDNFKEYT